MAYRVLHVLSNWKWTERSEPAVDLALAQKDLGAEVCFVCGAAPEAAGESVARNARNKGLKPVVTLPISKHFHVSSLVRGVPRLHALIRSFAPQVVHFHMLNAHFMGILAGLTTPPFCRVRSCYDPEGPKGNLRSRFLYRHYTDGTVLVSNGAKDGAIRRHAFPTDKLLVAEPGIDLGRFSPGRKIHLTRKDFGLHDDLFVVGLVSRIRESRRIDIAVGAVKILADRFPQLRLFIVGRGRKGAVAEVVEKPARAMNIADKIILPGYCHGDRLVAAYRAMDVLVYPMPGTDQTCRTVREALASGVPVLAPKIGFLAELLADGTNGHFIDLSDRRLAEVIASLVAHRETLQQMSRNALHGAIGRFSPHLQAKKVLAFYDRLLAH